jgi:hypothetical protein
LPRSNSEVQRAIEKMHKLRLQVRNLKARPKVFRCAGKKTLGGKEFNEQTGGSMLHTITRNHG